MSDRCKVDFYVLARPTQSAGEVVCRLAMKAWEQGFRVQIRAGSETEAQALDELMWDYPPGRFLPHEAAPAGEDVPVSITTPESGIPAHRDLVINLCTDPVPEPQRYRRLCEIVPAEAAQRTASREKYRVYRDLGLNPEKHDLN